MLSLSLSLSVTIYSSCYSVSVSVRIRLSGTGWFSPSELPLLPLLLLSSVSLSLSLSLFEDQTYPNSFIHWLCLRFVYIWFCLKLSLSGYSLRHLHETKVDQRLQSIENAVFISLSSLLSLFFWFRFLSSSKYTVVFCLWQMKNNVNLQHSEIKDIVGSGSGGCSLPACVATAGTTLLIGFVHFRVSFACLCKLILNTITLGITMSFYFDGFFFVAAFCIHCCDCCMVSFFVGIISIDIISAFCIYWLLVSIENVKMDEWWSCETR